MPFVKTLVAEKTAAAGTETVTYSDTGVECVRLPLVPTALIDKFPAGVVAPVVTVMVEEPEPTTEAGLKLALAPVGKPVALKVTVPLNPSVGEMVRL